ncbi:hypothetical protein JW707_04405 [Candidatus Woesearchaeota archaeon]|nr:hypothetical protein [Candidatus Woesearchaeota archaeon]
MNFRQHFLVGLLLLAIYPWLGAKTLLVFAASVFIDADHIHVIFSEKAFTYSRIKSLFEKYRTDKEIVQHIFCLFHTVEFIVVLYAFSLVYPVLIYIAIGFSFHIVCDIIFYGLIMDFSITRWLSFIGFLGANGAWDDD